LIPSRLPGQTLAEAWPSMDEELRQHYIGRVAGLCEKCPSGRVKPFMALMVAT
jgi:hypothetical protein